VFIVARNRAIDCCISLVDCCLIETILIGLQRVWCNCGSVTVIISCCLRTRDYFNEISWSIDQHCLILDHLIVVKGERTQVPFCIFVKRTRDYFNKRSWSIDWHCFFLDHLIVAKGERTQVPFCSFVEVVPASLRCKDLIRVRSWSIDWLTWTEVCTIDCNARVLKLPTFKVLWKKRQILQSCHYLQLIHLLRW